MSPKNLWTSMQWRVTQATIFFSITEESVLSSMPYLRPMALPSALPSRQSLTDWGIWSPNPLMRGIKLSRSEMPPLAALARTSPPKTTILWAVASSMQGTMVVGSGSLFCSKAPLRACWMISLSVGLGAFCLELPKTLWPQLAASKPVWQYFPPFQLLLRSPSHLWTSRQWRVTQAMTFFSITLPSVSGAMPYLRPRFQNYLLPSRQSLTDWGIWSPNPLMRSTSLTRSVTPPLAALSRSSPMKRTSLWAVASSMQGTTVVGSGSLFSSKRPLRPCWRISLSVMAWASRTSARIARIFPICRLFINLLSISHLKYEISTHLTRRLMREWKSKGMERGMEHRPFQMIFHSIFNISGIVKMGQLHSQVIQNKNDGKLSIEVTC